MSRRPVVTLRRHIIRWHRGNWRQPFLTEFCMAIDWDHATDLAIAAHPELVNEDTEMRVSEVGK